METDGIDREKSVDRKRENIYGVEKKKDAGTSEGDGCASDETGKGGDRGRGE